MHTTVEVSANHSKLGQISDSVGRGGGTDINAHFRKAIISLALASSAFICVEELTELLSLGLFAVGLGEHDGRVEDVDRPIDAMYSKKSIAD